MKGTFCGNRALRLVALAAVALAAAPAAASAGVGDPLGVSTAAAPAAPALPAAPAAPSVPAAPVSAPAVPASAASPVVAPAAPATAAPAKPAAKKVAGARARVRVQKNGTITATTSTTVDMRRLATTSSNPLMGCFGSYQLCQTFPDFPYAANNDCNNEQVSFVGQYTLWTQTTTNLLQGTITVHQRSFFVGFKGQGDQGNVYTGTDTQNDFQRTFVIGGPITTDHRDYEVLLVTKQNPLDPAQNEFEYFHTITSVDPLNPGAAQIAIQGPYIVCTCGAKHSKDTNYSGKYNDDDNGDKHHHHEGYKGYNDDSNTWDD